MATKTVDFVAGDFNSSVPKGSNGKYSTNLRVANKTQPIDLESNIYGLVTFTISYLGDLDYVSVIFSNPGGWVSVAESRDTLYTQSNSEYIINNILLDEKNSGTKTYYVVVNPDPSNMSQILNVSISVGKLKPSSPPVSSSVTLDYNCPDPIYLYEVGLHVYSPYDAIYSNAKLKSYLYSLTQITSWDVNTIVYSSPDFSNPALAYYYGYGDNVYKIGNNFDRTYGFTKYVTVKGRLFGKPTVKEHTIGPGSYFHGFGGYNWSEACVIPLMNGIGIIKQVIPNSSLSQPQQYRYYIGFDTSEKLSNDKVFVAWDWNTKKNYPIVGSTHALGKVSQGLSSGYNITINFGAKFTGWLSRLTTAKNPGEIPIDITLAAAGLGSIIYSIASVEAIASGCFDCGMTALQLLFEMPVIPIWISGAIVLAYTIFRIFQSLRTKTFNENCTEFQHIFTNTPYIVEGDVLYSDVNLSVIKNGYYCDGEYFYEHSGDVVNRKYPSFTTALINNNPQNFGLQYSIIADTPTIVQEITKLIILPYTSGKPLPYCGGSTVYYNNYISQTITNPCCDLETCDPVLIEVPSETTFSCISQIDADNQAETQLSEAVSFAEEQGVYSTEFPDEQVGTLDTAFTHELKIENNPTYITLSYDARTTYTPDIGNYLYYDSCGCTKVLDGYYTVSGESMYRTFYHTTNGVIDGIYEMQTSSDTTTLTSEPIITTNLDYSSNWYLTAISLTSLESRCAIIGTTRMFDTTTLYTDPSLKKGFIKTPDTREDFQLYDSFVTTDHAEAISGWYKPLIDWITGSSFFYQTNVSISLDIIEDCDYLTGGTTTRGFYVVGNDGEETPTINEVDLTVNVYIADSGITGIYHVKTSPSESRTFVDYGTQIAFTDKVVKIQIASIDSPNPSNRITFNIGTSTTCIVPTTGLYLTFYDITTISGYASVSTWNTLFDLPTNGTEFTDLQITGNTVNLMGGSGINLKDDLFFNNLHFPISVIDGSGCILSAGNNCFYNCINLNKVELPALATAGYQIFYGCEGLTGRLSFPVLTTIGNLGFYLCRSVLSFDLPILNTAGQECFRYCYSVSNFTLPSLSSLGEGGFENCDATSEFHLPSLTHALPYTFHACTSAVIFNLPSLDTADANSFYGCNSVKTFQLWNLVTAGNFAFYGCTSVAYFDLPSLFTIGDDTFANCTSVTGFALISLYSTGKDSFALCTSAKSFDFINVASIGDGCFAYSTSAEYFNLPLCTSLGSTVLNNNVFLGITGNTVQYTVDSTLLTCNLGQPDGDLQYLVVNNITNPELVLTFDSLLNSLLLISGFTYNSLSNWNNFFDLPTNGTPFTSLQVNGKSINFIGGKNIKLKPNLFSGYTHLTSIKDVSGCITSIADGAFLNCTNVKDINLPYTTIAGVDVFKNCTFLSGTTLSSLTTIGSSGFYNCSSMTDIRLPLVLSIGDSCFYGCTEVNSFDLSSCINLGSTTGNNNVFTTILNKTISLEIPSALMTCYNGNPDGDISDLILHNTVPITGITYSDGILLTFKYIQAADGMVGDATNVADWNNLFGLPTLGGEFTGVKIKGNSVLLQGSTGITLGVSLFDSVTPNKYLLGIVDNTNYCIHDADSFVFASCNNITTIILPNLQTAGDHCFDNCSSMTKFYLPNLISAGADCFYNCYNVRTFDLPLLQTAGNECFLYCTALTNANFTSMISGGVACFGQCELMTGFTLPNLTSIGDQGFIYCYDVNELYLPSCINLGSTLADDSVFLNITNRTINLTITETVLTCNSGAPDGDIDYLTGVTQNNVVTINGNTVSPCTGCNPIYTWIRTLDGITCYRIDTITASTPTNLTTLTARTSQYYSRLGTKLFKSFNSDGTGIFTSVGTNDIWKNNLGNNGPMNRCATWIGAISTQDVPQDSWVGFVQNLTNLTLGKTYYVGVGADNFYRISVNGGVVLETPIVNPPPTEIFDYWHIYPITFNTPTASLVIEGYNTGSIAGVGVEIYDNTELQILTATTINSLNIIFTSHNRIGTFMDSGDATSGYGYWCPSGYSISKVNGTYTCQQLIVC